MDLRPLRPALRLAVEVARDGELADPRVPAPQEIHRLLTFRRLSKSAYETIAHVLDVDDGFRRRVAERSDEAEIGRAGHLFLTRPEGWVESLQRAVAAGPDNPDERAALVARLSRARDGAEAAADRLRGELESVRAARDQLSERLVEVEARASEAESSRDELRSELDRLREERNEAVRSLKEVEAEVGHLRHDIRIAREATRDAERELEELRAASAPDPPASSGADRIVPTESGSGDPSSDPSAVEPSFDRDGLRAAVAGAAGAAADLARFLNRAERALEVASAGGQTRVHAPAGETGVAGRPAGRRRERRRAPALPFGVAAPSERASAAYLSDPDNLIVVDGYNLARTLWTGCSLEEERRRTVSLLEELHSRVGGEILVVFDGDDATTAPAASRSVRVRFSATGVTADEVILDLLADLAPDRPVVVVTSDREIADGARADGAVVLGSAEFAAAVGR